jgi:hypothetical protein
MLPNHGNLPTLIKRDLILSVNNNVVAPSEFELLTLRRRVSLLHTYSLILATRQATLELLIQTLQSIFFPIIEQLYEITRLSLQSKYNQLNDFSILIIFHIFKPIESSRLSLQRCGVMSRNHLLYFLTILLALKLQIEPM